MEELELNGIKYISQQKHDELIEEIKKTKTTDQKIASYGIMDCTNTTMFMQIHDEWENEKTEIISIPNPKFVFKKTDLLSKCKKSYDGEKIWTHKNHLISDNFVELFKKALLLFNYVDSEKKSRRSQPFEMVLYEGWDEKKNDWQTTFPVLIRYGNHGMIVAPRVDTE